MSERSESNGRALAPLLCATFLGCTGSSVHRGPVAWTPSPTLTPTPCAASGFLCDVAGQAGLSGHDGDGGPAAASRLNRPMDVHRDPAGNLWIVEYGNSDVRKVDSAGTITTSFGSLGDTCSGIGVNAGIDGPTAIAADANGFLYLSLWQNHKIKRFDPIVLQVFCVAGSSQGFSGDGGPAIWAQLDAPSCVAVDPAGNIYLTDQNNQRIRKIDGGNTIDTYSGSVAGYADGPALSALFNFPPSAQGVPAGKLGMNPAGTALYVADTGNHRIRRLDLASNTVTTVAGDGVAAFAGDGGPAQNASFNAPTDVAVAPDGSLFVADTLNQRIRKVSSAGLVSTVAGTGTAGSSPGGTLAVSARLNNPMGVYVASDGTLYIADTGNHQVKRLANP